MITKLRIGNFSSIGKEIELTFLKGGLKPEEGYFSFKKGKKASLINGFFGANASGKSNILRAIVTLIKLIYTIYSPKDGIGEVSLCNPNMHKDFENKPTHLGIDFLIGSHYYNYDIKIIDGNNIIEETLYLTTLEKKGAKPKEVFTRTDATMDFGPEYEDHKSYLAIAKIQNYQTFISHLINNVGAKAVIDFVDYRNANSFFLKTDEFDALMPELVTTMNSALRMNYSQQEKKDEFLMFTKDAVSCFDDSIENIEVNTDNNNVSIKVKHKDFLKSIDIMQESAGTRELFRHIYDILNVFKKGGVVVYDETNRYYHPDIEIALLSLFKNKEFNIKNAQLFFASHNHDVFDLLELEQAYIVEKTDSSTYAYNLSEVKDLKKRDNLKKKYRLGMLGGTPDAASFDYRLKQML